MATLILSTVGTALGGPVGGALGSIVGQAFDQSLFGPPARRGPRLGDLRVQTSSYGSQVPRIYGRMRVAGTVVWASDLVEQETVSAGKGAAAAIHYAYSASFAVALSSREAVRVGRIWAEGKLLRGEDGLFKTRTGFRFHCGGEGQEVDPLIAAIEGAEGAPAYRGLSLAVFEDLSLAEFGNRIPSLTFELIADEREPRVAEVISDASAGIVGVAGLDDRLVGYAAMGNDRRAAIEPLVELWGGAFFDDGRSVRWAGESPPIAIRAALDAGCSDGESSGKPISERHQEPADAMPQVLSIDYHEPSRDFQAGQMRATLGSGGRRRARIDSAAALTAEDAKGLASEALGRRWAARDRLTLRLSPDFLQVRPGQLLVIDSVPGLYRAEQVSIEALVVVVEARRAHVAGVAMAADSGRAAVAEDLAIGQLVPMLFDPPLLSADWGASGVLLAIGSTGAFKPAVAEVRSNGQPLAQVPVARPATTGRAASVLPVGQAQLIDRVSAVEVTLSNPYSLLLNADADALAMGANAAILGREILQFGRAEALGAGRYRLSTLVRGQRASEWAMADHSVGEPFVMLDTAALHRISVDRAMAGSTIEASALGVADDPMAPPSAELVFGAESLRPLAPYRVRFERRTGGGTISWTARRTELFGWSAGSDPDVGGASFIVTLTRDAAPLSRQVVGTTIDLAEDELGALGAGPLAVRVVEIGSGGTSRPALAEISI